MKSQSTSPPRILLNIGLVEILPDVLKGVQRFVQENHCPWHIRHVTQETFARRLKEGSFDAAMTTIAPQEAEHLAHLSAARAAIVNLVHDCHPALASVVADEAAVGRLAAEYFLGRGYRNFGYVGFNSAWSQARQRGFSETLARASRRCHVCEHWAGAADDQFIEDAQSQQVVLSWIASLPKPVAVLVCADGIAAAAMEKWNDAGILIPQDVAVMGVGNFSPACELCAVPLTSVAIDFAQMGFQAAQMLAGMMETGKAVQEPLRLPPIGIVARRSTDGFEFQDEYVSAAMRLIHNRAADGVTMKQLLRQVPVSRQWLDARFKETIGRTASQEIRRLRLERICDLLLNSDLSVQQIASRCGFSRPENLTRFFRDSVGVPPGLYRSRTQAAGFSEAIRPSRKMI